jgi:predicted flap endonuclease-1-like 5' DNA nuclease
MAKLEEIEGVGEKYAQKLASAGVKSTDDLP